MRLDEILVAHAFMRTESPPELWEADTDDERFLPMLGEMIALGLGRGGALEELTLSASNVVVEPDEDGEEEPWLDAGEYVAISVKGLGRWADDVWRAGEGPTLGLLANVAPRADDAGAVFAYTRDLGDGGAVTAYLRRLTGEAGRDGGPGAAGP